MRDLEAVLWELESAGGKANNLNVSLEFWKEMQCDKNILLKSNGEIYYRYLKVDVDPKLEEGFLLY